MTEFKLGPVDMHFGLRKNGKTFIVDAIDKEGNIHENYSIVEAKTRKEAEKSVCESHYTDNVIFDY